MNKLLRVVAALALLGASLFPMTASAQGCTRTAFPLDDVQGVYDGMNIEMLVFPCGGVVVRTGVNGNLQWVSDYYGSERVADGSIMVKYTPFQNTKPLVWEGIGFEQLVLTPDVPGRIHLWGVTRAGNWFDTYLDKTSDDPNV